MLLLHLRLDDRTKQSHLFLSLLFFPKFLFVTILVVDIGDALADAAVTEFLALATELLPVRHLRLLIRVELFVARGLQVTGIHLAVAAGADLIVVGPAAGTPPVLATVLAVEGPRHLFVR